MTERAGYTDTGGVEHYIPIEELLERPEVQGIAADNLSSTYRADDAVWAEEHDDGSVTLDISFAQGGLVDRNGTKLQQMIDDIDSGYPPQLAWVKRGSLLPLSLTNGEHMKPAVTVQVHFTPEGEVAYYSIFPSRIKAQAMERTDFEEALTRSEPGDEYWPLKKASRFMRSNPQTTDLIEEVWHPSNRSRFGDFSILANAIITHTMLNNDVPWLYRNYHPQHPFDVGDIHEHDLPELIERLMEEVGSAYFRSVPVRHDGVALRAYGYAAGQLARLPNRINGILLTSWLDGNDMPITHDDMETLARWLNTKKFDGNARKRYPEIFSILEDDIALEEVL